MKHLHTLLAAALVALAASLAAGCSSCGSGQDRRTSFDTIGQLTKADTVRVFEQTDAFMRQLRDGTLDSALNMLSEEVEGEAMPLIDSVKTRYRQQFKRFPVLDYELETSTFARHEYATATYRYRFMDNPTDDPNYPCTMRLTIESRLMQGRYVLMLHNYSYITR